jgi:hypothetical protein
VSIATRERVRLAVTVGTQQLKVLYPVVVPVPVDVVERHGQRAPAPLRQAAAFAPAVLDPCPDQALLEVATAAPAICGEDLFEWPKARAGRDRASQDGLVPGPTTETERLDAVADAVRIVVNACTSDQSMRLANRSSIPSPSFPA